MQSSKEITLGVPFLYGERDALRVSICSFLNPAANVIAVDNGSSDECKAVLSEFDGRIAVVRNERNVFVNPAWNQIAAIFLAETSSEILAIANSDIVLSAGWGERLMRALETLPPKRFWLGRQTDLAQLAGASGDDTVEDKPPIWSVGGSWGSFFAIRRRDVERCFPIPDALKLHFGDNWVFNLLIRSGVQPAIVNGVRLFHAGAVSVCRLSEAASIAANDMALWHGRYAADCKLAADSAAKSMETDELELKYRYFVDTLSYDINEHLPTIRAYAEECDRVVEFGFGRSTCALAHARPKSIRCYDPSPDAVRASVSEISHLARSSGVDMIFSRESSLECHVEPADMLLIDTIHTFQQLSEELRRHADSISKYILMHDTETFGSIGEDGSKPGLNAAVDTFLFEHRDWKLEDRFKNNNGLTVLKRVAPVASQMVLVTAFFRLGDRRVDEGEYFQRFYELAGGGMPIILFLDERVPPPPSRPNVQVVPLKLDRLWPFERAAGVELILPAKRALEKDTRDFMLLQSSKIEFLGEASRIRPEAPCFAWIDFAVMKCVVDRSSFLAQLASYRFDGPASTPGCWTREVSDLSDPEAVSWRFCGGFIAIKRDAIEPILSACRDLLAAMIDSGRITWEINLWAALERRGIDFGWYRANHDDTLIRRFEPSGESAVSALKQLFEQHGTDKGRNGYTSMYERILDPIRRRPLRILEIGIGTLDPSAFGTMVGFHGAGYRPGGSLRAFRDYCPNARIFGIDTQPDAQFSEERIETGICDSIDALDVARLFAWRHDLFDLVIDDGAHWPQMQMATLVNFHSKVALGGHYVIEDINGADSYVFHFWEAIVGYRFRMIERRINALVLERV